MDVGVAEVGLGLALLTHFGTFVWWAGRLTQNVNGLKDAVGELRYDVTHGTFPKCVEHTEQIAHIAKTADETRHNLVRLHERLDNMGNSVMSRKTW